MKRLVHIFILLIFCTVTLVACGNDELNDKASIVGTWVEGNTVMVLGKDGSYRIDYNDSFGQYRTGTYSYNSKQGLLVINVKAIPNQNGAYTQTLIVQNLTSTSLVLMHLDGDIEGYYTRQK